MSIFLQLNLTNLQIIQIKVLNINNYTQFLGTLNGSNIFVENLSLSDSNSLFFDIAPLNEIYLNNKILKIISKIILMILCIYKIVIKLPFQTGTY